MGIMEKITTENRNNKLIAFAAVLSIIIGIFGFGYGWTEDHDGFGDNFTVSYAIGRGEKPVIAFLIAIGGLLSAYLVYRKQNGLTKTRIFLITLIAILLISLMYINPWNPGHDPSNQNISKQHGGLALSAFTVTLIFNLITFHILRKETGKDLLFISLSVLNVIVYLGIYVIVYIAIENALTFFKNYTGIELNELGTTAEILQILFFLLAILLTGIY